jgi:hypothetical protein
MKVGCLYIRCKYFKLKFCFEICDYYIESCSYKIKFRNGEGTYLFPRYSRDRSVESTTDYRLYLMFEKISRRHVLTISEHFQLTIPGFQIIEMIHFHENSFYN